MSYQYGMRRHRDPWHEEEDWMEWNSEAQSFKENHQQKNTANETGPVIQPKLNNNAESVLSPEHKLEKEADEVSRKVTEGKTVDAASISGGKPATSTEHSGSISPDFLTRLNQDSGGQPLNESAKHEMESGIGTDLSAVRIHTDEKAKAYNASLDSQAFTFGNNIYFGENESPDNKSLLAHELTHTVQQSGNVQRMVQRQCNVPEALDWYKTNKYGKTVVFSKQLALQLYDAAGTGAKAEYDQAIAENKIGTGFVELVCKAQAALNCDLTDGKYGPTTKQKLADFRTGGKHGIDYNKLTSKIIPGTQYRTLNIGVAIGESFSGERTNVIKLLTNDHKFKLFTSSKEKDTYYKFGYQTIPGDDKAEAVPLLILVDVVYESNTNPADTYGKFLAGKDIVIYSGHARYGTGPDFDAKDSNAGNFVIGVNSTKHNTPNSGLTKGYDAHMNETLKNEKNDLEQMSKGNKFDMNKYQVWMFNACTSNQYKDEVRGGLVADSQGNSKSSDNLRFVGTQHSIISDCVPMLDGVLKFHTMEQIIKDMDAYEIKNVRDYNKSHPNDQEPLYKTYYQAD